MPLGKASGTPTAGYVGQARGSMPSDDPIAAAVSGCCRAKSHASLVILLKVSLIEHDGDPGFGAVASEAAV